MEGDGWSWEHGQFMTDFYEQEINAIKKHYPGTLVYLCDFHQEDRWTRWVSKIDNGVSHEKGNVHRLLRQCAHAISPEAADSQTLQNLHNSPVWHQNAILRAWFSRTLLPESGMEYSYSYLYSYLLDYFFSVLSCTLYLANFMSTCNRTYLSTVTKKPCTHEYITSTTEYFF